MEKVFTDSCSKAGGDRIKHQKKSVKIKKKTMHQNLNTERTAERKKKITPTCQQERERRYGEFKEESFS